LTNSVTVVFASAGSANAIAANGIFRQNDAVSPTY
jgi:hypothetical protein